VPPLRERRLRFRFFFRHFLQKYSEKFGKTPPGPSKYLLDAAVNYPGRATCASWRISLKRYVILEDDEGSLRELVRDVLDAQRTSPREEPARPRSKG